MTQPLSDPPRKPFVPQYIPSASRLALIGATILGVVLIRWQFENLRIGMIDEAVLNLISMSLSALVVINLVAWFITKSVYAKNARVVFLLLVVIAIGAFFYNVTVEGVTGNMVLKLRWRWQPPRDAKLAIEPAAEEIKANLQDVSAKDITGFLGNDRTNYMAKPALDPHWEASPPQEVWRRPMGAAWSQFVSVNGFAITMEQRGTEELVTCYQLSDGKPVWTYSHTARHENTLGGIGPRSTPTIHNGKVYSLGATGHLACLSGEDGKSIWTKDLFAEQGMTQTAAEGAVYWGRAASPLLLDGNVIVPLGGTAENTASLVAYDALTGEEKWRGGHEQISYSSPILFTLAGVPQIVIVNESSVTGHQTSDGKELWKHEWPGRSSGNASSSMPHYLGEDKILLSKGYGQGCEVIQVTKDQDRWSVESLATNHKSLLTKYTNLTIIDENAYALSDGIMECVSLPDLKRRWKTSQGRFGHGQVLGVGKHILVQTEQMEEILLVDANPNKLTVLGRIPGPKGKSWNNFCLVGDLLLARSEEEAVCYQLPLAK